MQVEPGAKPLTDLTNPTSEDAACAHLEAIASRKSRFSSYCGVTDESKGLHGQ